MRQWFDQGERETAAGLLSPQRLVPAAPGLKGRPVKGPAREATPQAAASAPSKASPPP